MTFTAKVTVQNNEPLQNDTNYISFVPDYAEGRNAEWSKWTPAMTLNMTVKSELGRKIAVGQKYTLTFTEEDE